MDGQIRITDREVWEATTFQGNIPVATIFQRAFYSETPTTKGFWVVLRFSPFKKELASGFYKLSDLENSGVSLV